MSAKKPFTLTKEILIPTISKGFAHVGFLFGAGTSYEAGYPLMSGLTKIVASKLSPNDIGIIETAIDKFNKESDIKYNINDKFPDVEILLNMISDLKAISGYYTVSYNLEQKLRKVIYETLKNVQNPNLEYHVKFLDFLKNRIGINSIPFWIFTTNYDLLFELASSNCKLNIENGFCGISRRFFDLDCLTRIQGYYKPQKIRRMIPFEEHKEAHLKLCKLHGSLSWYKNSENDVLELCDSSLVPPDYHEVMIYPERKKLDDTLAHPYDKFFVYANNILGNNVKYLLSSGYSYRDEHINDRLLLPKLRNGNLRIFALFETEPDCIKPLKDFSSFNYLTKDYIHFNGETIEYKNELWKFSKFINYITE